VLHLALGILIVIIHLPNSQPNLLMKANVNRQWHLAQSGHISQAHKFAALPSVRQWLDNLEIRNPKMARILCHFIPAQCPFERDVKLFGRIVAHIPPLCKLNPFYEQVAALRFRALCYLADQCGEDVSSYC
jgi:Mo-dependent nitrogenase C-terminus